MNGRHRVDPQILNDHLPIGVLVVDQAGTVKHVNLRAADMIGHEPDELVGRSVVDFVDERDLEFVTTSLDAASAYRDEIMGPSRLRYRDRSGTERVTEYWSFRCPESFGFDGYIVTLSTESVTDNLANAAYQIASDEPLVVPLESIARAVAAYPLVASGAFLIPQRDVDENGRLQVVGPWPSSLTRFVDDPTMPWHDVALTGDLHDVGVDALPAPIAEAARAEGFRSLWIRAVVTHAAHVAAVFVGWRRETDGSSPNQERHLAEAVGVARLAFDHDEHRRALERAALFDQLTGLGNRALLARDLADAEHSDVTVMYIDLDGFKQVNDVHGHDVGDLVLAAAAQRLRSVTREVDSVYRIGGDEFIVLCADLDGRRGSEDDVVPAIADRIIGALTSPFRIGAATIETGASIGVAHREPDEKTADIVRRADRALLRAKRDGKAQWQFAEPRSA